jgi:DNA-directed RNA polymerase subunit M/transcription elongation factor TFIIS
MDNNNSPRRCWADMCDDESEPELKELLGEGDRDGEFYAHAADTNREQMLNSGMAKNFETETVWNTVDRKGDKQIKKKQKEEYKKRKCDKNINCDKCGTDFIFHIKQQLRFDENKWMYPLKCYNCKRIERWGR